MTLTELKYIVAVARERHFGRAADACFVSQPTLSHAIRRLQGTLGLGLAERGGTAGGVTPVALKVHSHAPPVLEKATDSNDSARQDHDPQIGHKRVSVI